MLNSRIALISICIFVPEIVRADNASVPTPTPLEFSYYKWTGQDGDHVGYGLKGDAGDPREITYCLTSHKTAKVSASQLHSVDSCDKNIGPTIAFGFNATLVGDLATANGSKLKIDGKEFALPAAVAQEWLGSNLKDGDSVAIVSKGSAWQTSAEAIEGFGQAIRGDAAAWSTLSIEKESK